MELGLEEMCRGRGGLGGGGGVWAVGRFAPDSPKKQLQARVALRARGRLPARGMTVCPAEQDRPPEGNCRRQGKPRGQGRFLSCFASGGIEGKRGTRSGFAASRAWSKGGRPWLSSPSGSAARSSTRSDSSSRCAPYGPAGEQPWRCTFWMPRRFASQNIIAHGGERRIRQNSCPTDG